jgi:hypothetical protein
MGCDACGWLRDTPPNDSNFLGALKQATEDEIRRALEYREARPKNKTAAAALRAELGRRRRAAKGETE